MIIMMNNKLLTMALLSISLGTLLQAASKAPNVVVILADDMGYECIGAHGGTSYKTPRLDKLAGEGMLFEQCHAQPLCTPSRVKIMTGTSNVVNYYKFARLDRKGKTFGHYFQDAGYATAITGKWQLGPEKDSPLHFGFDEAFLWQHKIGRSVKGFNGDKRDSRYGSPWLEHTRRVDGKIKSEVKQYPRKYGPDLTADFACNFIEENKEKPFFLYYPMTLIHCPFDSTPDSSDWENNNLGSLSYEGKPEYIGDMVAYCDKTVGRIIDCLEKNGLRENTLLIFTGDNGTDSPIVSMMGDKEIIGSKGKTIDWGTHVPFIASWPGVIPEGTTYPHLIDFSDILPTICAAAGIEVPESPLLTGRSFLPQLKGDKTASREWLYSWYQAREKDPLKVFTRNIQYKLYKTGEFHDLFDDIQEKNPLKVEDLSGEALRVKAELQEVLDRFKDLEGKRSKKHPKT